MDCSKSMMQFDQSLLALPELHEGSVNVMIDDIDALVNRLSSKERCAFALQILRCVDLTILNATDGRADVELVIERAVQPLRDLFPTDWPRAIKCAAVCLYPNLVSTARAYRDEHYPNCGVKLATVAGGFPSGQYMLETKCLEVQLAVQDGAEEVDIVINRGLAVEGDWRKVYDEVESMKLKCPPNVQMKTILAVGDLDSLENVYNASMVAMMAGSDFLKTSTGKERVNANLRHSYVMCLAISHFYQSTRRRVGFKAAGGITSLNDAMTYFMLVKRVLGDDWLCKELFRIGASSLLDNLVAYLKTASKELNIKQLLDN